MPGLKAIHRPTGRIVNVVKKQVKMKRKPQQNISNKNNVA